MLLKVAGVGLLAWSARVAWWRFPVSYLRPRVLMYHMVAEPVLKSSLNKWRVTPRLFERQMRCLLDNGWNVVTMSELMSAQQLPPKTVALTFDDGFSCCYDTVLPVLTDLDLPATVYLLSDVTDNSWDSIKESRRQSLLSGRQIENLLASGLIELGVHGASHKNLTTLSDDDLLTEVSTCRVELIERYGQPFESFAYPFGQYDARVIAAVKHAGYSNAVIVGNRVFDCDNDDCYEIPRLTMDGRRAGLFDFYLQLTRGRCKW